MVDDKKGAMKILRDMAKMKTVDFLQARGDDAPLEYIEDYVFARYNLFWGGKGMMRNPKNRSAGHVDKEPNNVYRALKKAMLKHTKFGILTGKTLKAIHSWNEDNTLYAGIKDERLWLENTPAGAVQYSFRKFFDEHLKRIWGDVGKAESVMMATSRQKGSRKWVAISGESKWRRSKEISAMQTVDDGNIVMRASADGLSVKWPLSARALGLRDIETPNTTFANKKYGVRQRDLKTAFFMTKDFENRIFNIVKKSAINQFWKVE